jgi:hypothetical protein
VIVHRLVEDKLLNRRRGCSSNLFTSNWGIKNTDAEGRNEINELADLKEKRVCI